MYKICIWENIPSPHQSHFFKAVTDHFEIDLQVRYFEHFHEERASLGWQDIEKLPVNEQYVTPEINQALASVPDWEDRIHIIPGLSYCFTRKLLDRLIECQVKWAHWSERSGIGLARKLHYNVYLFNFLQPFVSKILKGNYAKKINKYAIGVFAQGQLAKLDFINWGVQSDKIEFLFYTIGEISKPKALPDEYSQNIEKKMFIYAGSLDDRKGIRELLKAFSTLKNSNQWLLILVGLDKSFGRYFDIAKNLEIDSHVVFIGTKQIDIVPEYIGCADVFILPSLFDGWGAVLNEAAAMGKPIISTDQAGAAFHLINENVNGFRVQAGNIKKLAEVMQYYVDNPDIIKRHGIESLKIYNDFFTPEMNVFRFVNSIKKWGADDNKCIKARS